LRVFAAIPVVAVLLLLPAGCGQGSQAARDARSVVGTIGRQGLSNGQFYYPRGIAASPDGRIFVADRTGRIQRFDASGHLQKVWETPEHKAGYPVGMGFAPDGRLFVADTHYSRVLIYDKDGQLLDKFGRPGRGPGEFEMPTDVAVDRQGNIYVSETGGNDRISKFDAKFNYIQSFGGADDGAAATSRPVGLTIDRDDTLWVADAVNHRLLRFSLDGKLLATIGSIGSQLGQFRYPYDTALMPDGTLIVAEYGNNRLQQVTRDGKSLRTWGQAGWQIGQLGYPWGVAVTKGRVYVVDSGNNRVQVIDW
jgi:DNA-binding beta-propeller fold protein YncE